MIRLERKTDNIKKKRTIYTFFAESLGEKNTAEGITSQKITFFNSYKACEKSFVKKVEMR
jgi:hypothetical protein